MNFKRIIKKSISIILALAIMVGVLTHFSMDVEAANGTWNGGHIYRDGFWLRVDWSESAKNPKTNKSTVTATVYLVQKANYSLNVGASRAVTIKIGDSTYNTKTTSAINNSGGITTKLGTYSTTVTHNSNGSLNVPITATFAMNATLGSTKYTTMTTTNTAVLDTLDRAAPSITTTVSNITSTSITLKGTSNTPSESWAYSKDGGNTWTSFGSSGTSTAVTVSGLNPSTTYSFKIRAKKTSNDITGISSTVLGLTLPPNASGLAVNKISDTSAKLTWKSVTGATSYNVYKNGTLLSSGIKSLQYDFDGLISGVEYNLGVSAANPSGNSGITTIKFMLPPAGNPTNLKISSSTPNTATLTWDKVQGASSYTLYKNGKIIESDVKELDYTFTNLKHGEIALLAVHAENAGGTSDISELTYTVPPKSAPTGLSILSETEMTTTLQWDPVEGATSYIIYLDGNVLEENITETNYEYTELMGGSEHILGVVAKNNGGKTEISILEHTTRIQIPSNVKIQSQTTETVSLSWKKQGNQIHHYNIYRDGEKIGESVEPKYIDNTYGNTVSIYRVSAVTHENIETELSLEIPTLDITGPDIQLNVIENEGLSVRITAMFEDVQSGIDEKSLTWAYGEHEIGFFESNGNSFSDSYFEVTHNGVYTVFAKDKAGNGSIKTVDVTQVIYESKIGAYKYSTTDLTVDAPGITMDFSRFYDSTNNEIGPLGKGWRIQFTGKLFEKDNHVFIQLPEGSPYIFRKESNSYIGVNTTAELKVSNNKKTLKLADQFYHFDANGNLVEISDKNGNSVQIELNQDGYPNRIIDSVGRLYEFVYKEKLLTQIKDPAGRVIELEYKNGSLYQVRNVKGNPLQTYETNEDGLITLIKDKNNSTIDTIYYDYLNRVMGNSQDEVIEYGYDIQGLQTMKTGEKKEKYSNTGKIIVDLEGNKFSYNLFTDNLEYIEKSDGGSVWYQYDDQGSCITITTKNNQGKIIEKNNVNLTYFENTSDIQIRIETTTEYSESSEGISEEKTTVITTNYDNRGNILTIQEITENSNSIMSNVFDGRGLLKTTIDKTGVTTNFEYDSYGNPIEMTSLSPNEDAVTTKYENNIIGFTHKMETARGVISEFIFDELGNILKSTVKDKDDNVRIVRSVYNKRGEKIQEISALEYKNSEDRLSSIDNYIAKHDNYNLPNAGVIYLYSNLGNVIETKTRDYKIEKNSDSKISSVSVGNNIIAKYNYDQEEKELLSSITYANNTEISYEYDENGNRISLKINNDIKFKYSYDDENRLIKKEDYRNGYRTEFEYLDNEEIRVERYHLTHNKKIESYTIGKEYNSITHEIQRSTYSYTKDQNNHETFKKDNKDLINKKVERGLNDRINKEVFTKEEIPYFTNEYSYDSHGAIVGLIQGKENQFNSYAYTYDGFENITRIEKNEAEIKSYVYDEGNQLLRSNLKELDETILYEYDDYGNILKKSIYKYTLGNLDNIEPEEIIVYNYENPNFKDQLSSYNGQSITYDEIGNPLNYLGWKMSWENGRDLKEISKDSSKLLFSYDDLGIRTTKNVNGKIVNYTNRDGLITSQNDGENNFIFHYNSESKIVGFTLNEATYTYIKSTQDDVIGIMDSNGNIVVTYEYDDWGDTKLISGSLAESIGVMNPFRYRSYYLDVETNLYYLQSRYFDPSVGRFINTDAPEILGMMSSTAETNIAHNLYTYVLNNPINLEDHTGHAALTMYISYQKMMTLTSIGPMIMSGMTSVFKSIKAAIALSWSIPLALAAAAIAVVGIIKLVRVAKSITSAMLSAKAAVQSAIRTKGITKHGDNTVYIIIIVKGEKVIYTGRTNNFERRKKEHFNIRFNERVHAMYGVMTNLTLMQARATEQVIINIYTLDGLLNCINSIAMKNWSKFDEAFKQIDGMMKSQIDPN